MESIVSLAVLLLEIRRGSLDRAPDAPVNSPAQLGCVFVFPVNDENQNDILCLLMVIALLTPTYFDNTSSRRGSPPTAPIAAAINLVTSAMLRLQSDVPPVHQCFLLSRELIQALQVSFAAMTERSHESWKLEPDSLRAPLDCFCRRLEEVGEQMEPYYPEGMSWKGEEPAAASILAALPPTREVLDLTEDDDETLMEWPPVQVKLEDSPFGMDFHPLLSPIRPIPAELSLSPMQQEAFMQWPLYSPMPVSPMRPLLLTPAMTPMLRPQPQPAAAAAAAAAAQPPPIQPAAHPQSAAQPQPQHAAAAAAQPEVKEELPRKRKAAEEPDDILSSLRSKFRLANTVDSAAAAAAAAAEAVAAATLAAATQAAIAASAAEARRFRDQIEAELLAAKAAGA